MENIFLCSRDIELIIIISLNDTVIFKIEIELIKRNEVTFFCILVKILRILSLGGLKS